MRDGDSAAEAPPTSYLTSEHTIRSWLLTTDHKRIALLFFASITFFFFIGGIAATLIRLHLATPEGLLQPDIYNRMFTMHGVMMVWFFLIRRFRRRSAISSYPWRSAPTIWRFRGSTSAAGTSSTCRGSCCSTR